MTASDRENALAAQSQALGEASEQAWSGHAESMHATISGSEVDVTDASRGPDDAAVQWTGSDTGRPPGPSLPQTRDPNATSPYDGSRP